MREIKQYFDDLRRDLKSKRNVVSVRDKNANRKGPNFEERTYEVYIRERDHDRIDEICEEIQQELDVQAEVRQDENPYIFVKSSYDAN